jgi:hypothetical protein
MTKIRSGWSPTMEQRADLDGRQVKCLIASEGHTWMRSYFDRLPSPDEESNAKQKLAAIEAKRARRKQAMAQQKADPKRLCTHRVWAIDPTQRRNRWDGSRLNWRGCYRGSSSSAA